MRSAPLCSRSRAAWAMCPKSAASRLGAIRTESRHGVQVDRGIRGFCQRVVATPSRFMGSSSDPSAAVRVATPVEDHREVRQRLRPRIEARQPSGYGSIPARQRRGPSRIRHLSRVPRFSRNPVAMLTARRHRVAQRAMPQPPRRGTRRARRRRVDARRGHLARAVAASAGTLAAPVTMNATAAAALIAGIGERHAVVRLVVGEPARRPAIGHVERRRPRKQRRGMAVLAEAEEDHVESRRAARTGGQ